jgi:hypothetical protein
MNTAEVRAQLLKTHSCHTDNTFRTVPSHKTLPLFFISDKHGFLGAPQLRIEASPVYQLLMGTTFSYASVPQHNDKIRVINGA